ncbi:MAG: phenylacetate--CoA ligase [Chthonomonadaceae bacterium]|nr:phenylacetate--CoA ligase [Chthonomonadaceae bacterium]
MPAYRHEAVYRLQQFLNTPLDALLHQSDPLQAALHVCSQTARMTPAYRAFLAEHDLAPHAIVSVDDFLSLPHLTKQNYLLKHPLPDLCRNGKLEECDMIAVSSGSTGSPCFWPRFLTDELAIAVRFEQIFHDAFRADERRTLVVICFALGTWVGGMYTAACCRHLATKGYPLTVITPGNNREEIFRVVQELGSLYEQVVLCGYPPFLKDVIDSGRARGIDWTPYGIKLVMAGEVFSEEWRTLVGERVGMQDVCTDTASLYGTADAGVLGNETPLSIWIRRFLSENPQASRALFGESRLPTLVQYDPNSRFFEVHDGHLLFTGDNGIPLVRYNILDTGGIVPYAEMLEFLAAVGFDPLAELGPKRRGIRPLPFVYVFGRSNFTISYFGANIYPENITVGLEQPHIREWVTGKFVLEAREDSDRNRSLSITIELAPGESADESRQQAVAESILIHLLRLNTEFANYTPPEYRTPQVILLPTGDPDYFPVGVKHRYTRQPLR